MILVSKEPSEFRIKRSYTAQNGNNSFFYTFENDEVGSFELWSKDNLALEKGKQYLLKFDLTFYQGDKRINLKGADPIGK